MSDHSQLGAKRSARKTARKTHPILSERAKPPDAARKSKQVIELSEPTLYVLDCGCWCELKNKAHHTFGVICGSHVMLGTVSPRRPGINIKPRHTANSKLNAFLAIEFKVDDATFGVDELHLVEVRATSEDEHAQPGEILCKKDRLYLFIPDLHLCQGKTDACDFFVRQYNHATILARFLEKCKSTGAVVVQTGDMLDLWMAEASVHNYFISVPGKSYYRAAERSKRLEQAAGAIKKAIENSPYASDIESIFKSIDHYILGNHDWELRFPECAELSGYLRKLGVKIHDGIGPWLGVDGDRIERFHVIHGHQFDAYNNTERASDVNTAMDVKGKAITFAFARYVRRVEVHADLEGEVAYLDKGTEKRLGDWTPLMYLDLDHLQDEKDFEFVGSWLNVLNPLAPSPALLDVMGPAERYGFGNNREEILRDILSKLNARNYPNNIDLDLKNTDKFFAGYRNYEVADRVIEWTHQKLSTSRRPIELGTRVLVHSHTHNQMLTTIRFAYKKPA